MTDPPLISIVFEGDTEEAVIEKILELFMINPKKEGYHLYSAEGLGNLGARNLDGLINLAKSKQMEIYLVIDNDASAKLILKQHKALGNIRDDTVTI